MQGITGSSLAQVPQSIDSLETYAQIHSPNDTNYVNALLQLGRLTTRVKANYQRADSILRVADKIAGELHFGRGAYRANTYIAANYNLSDRPQQTLEFVQKALTVAETYKLSPSTIAGAMTNLATAYNALHQYEKAIDVSLRSLRMQEQYNIQPRNELTYNNIGLALKDTKRPHQAIGYFRKALALTQKLNDVYGLAIHEQNIGRCYDDLNQSAQALTYYRSALKHARQSGSELLQSDILVNTGLVLRKAKRLDEAKHAIELALAISTKQKHQSGMATDYFNLGQVCEELKEYKLAEQYMKKALGLANDMGNKDKAAIYTQGLANLYGGMNDFQQAYAFQLARNQAMDSSTAIRTTAEVQRLVAKYQTEKKEARIKLLQQQAVFSQRETELIRFRTKALLVGSLLVLMLGTAVTAWILNRSRLRRLEEAQQLRKQIAQDLHDEVGSTLSSISLLSGHTNKLLLENRPESAQKMVQKIYTDARQILESIDEIIWVINPSNDSLHRIALRLQAYAQPLMESKNIRFSFLSESLTPDTPVSIEVRRNLFLIGKEAINNMIKYSEATQAIIRFDRVDKQLQVVIEDNGRGFNTTQSSQRTGQTSMHHRAQAMGGQLAVRSAPGQGTQLQLTVSLNN